jgi:hypothetical protein
MSQCQGITKQGQRCRIKTKGKYCQHHGSFKPLTPSRGLPDRGFIYVYTLSHLLDSSPKKKEWLQIQSKGSKIFETFDPKKHILVKIGMTRGSVRKRLKQWEAQCSHKISIIDPYQRPKKSLISIFQCLTVTDYYQYYIPEQHGFQCSNKLFEVEQSIHKLVADQYGRGDVHCHGCKEQGHGLHIEWFKVSRSDLHSIFTIIDNTIGRHTSN